MAATHDCHCLPIKTIAVATSLHELVAMIAAVPQDALRPDIVGPGRELEFRLLHWSGDWHLGRSLYGDLLMVASSRNS
jgi:hypothetical protein